MRMLSTVTLFSVVAVANGTAQQNPFKLPKSTLKAQISYQLSGDQKGTSESAIDGDRYMTRTVASMKMMGKETKMSTWTLVTADSMYNVDLEKKEGYAAPNLLPLYAGAYDDLDGAGKKRFHANLKDVGTMMTKVFDVNSFGGAGEKVGDETIAGEVCENRQFGGFTICSMKKNPRLSLKTTGDIVCFRMEQTATSVSLTPPPGSAFEAPAGIKFRPMLREQDPDSAAHAMVSYLASQQLADSLAKARTELEAAKADAKAKGQPSEMTPEQKESMKQACDMVKNVDISAVMANAWTEMKQAVKGAAVDAAERSATNKIRGFIKKPRLP